MVIAGGNVTVSADVEAEVRALLAGIEIVRAAGDSRYTTAVALADRSVVAADTVFVATGTAFADALAGTPAAIRGSAPVVLVPRTGQVPQAVSDFVARVHPDRLIIVGGRAAIPQVIIDQLS